MHDEVNYDHKRHRHAHTVSGARAVLSLLFQERHPESLLDVGCGWGTWLRAALDLGVPEVVGVDGAAVSESDFLCPFTLFRQQNLCEQWDLDRRFDVALCLEVAEHLPPEAAPVLVASLVRHSDLILFSAAAPRQPGQHHVNCQWPEYWQEIFNRHGYTCDDGARWKIWNDAAIEPWYRQNIFRATRSTHVASTEERIRRVIHPEMLSGERATYRSEIERGILPMSWYLSIPHKAVAAKLRRKFLKVITASGS
ncbi:MAG TPA: class I SAM-dependent methyltransferase [Stellaceae bacterium]|nr:class I SAM-dependent methyltransferase [Stellaceae bacterium]